MQKLHGAIGALPVPTGVPLGKRMVARAKTTNSRILVWALAIGLQFAGWRERFADSDVGAWGGLGLLGAGFGARLELLGWNPFEVNLAQLSA